MNRDWPAFPFEYHNQTRSYQPGLFGEPDVALGASLQFTGMTLRDYFAAAALQGVAKFVFEMSELHHIRPSNEIEIAQQAYAIADAMLEARNAP